MYDGIIVTVGCVQAQAEAAAAGLKCPSTALHYACHLAPWGLQSDDLTIYMHWNLNFALLPLISQVGRCW